MLTIGSFLFFTALVGVLTYFITRKDDHDSSAGYFLAGRSLTFPLIAGSLLLTNLSTEQLVGLNGAAYQDGLCVMVWEVWAVFTLVAMAFFFLPRFLKSGVTTVPEYLEIRFDSQTQVITNLIFLVAYVAILLPVILYTGAKGLVDILDVPSLLGLQSAQDKVMGFEPKMFVMIVTVWVVGIVGSIYALFGGLKSVAVSDTLNGVGLLVGGLMIPCFALSMLGGDGGFSEGYQIFVNSQRERFNSIGSNTSTVPFGTLFSGIILLNAFYWTTNQQIIQRTFGASSLAEGQKGVLLTGLLKLIGPLFLVVPGMIAFTMFAGQNVPQNEAYGKLVSQVLPPWLTGFFAAVMVGAILSSFNSALNSTCTLFSLGLYKRFINPNATDRQTVFSSTIFGTLIAIASMLVAPLLEPTDPSSPGIFQYLQKMNGMYFIPIFAVCLIGMTTKRVPPIAAKIALLVGFGVISLGYFVSPFDKIVASMHEFHFLGVVFAWLIIIMLLIGEVWPLKVPFEQQDVKAVDMTPWKGTVPCGLMLVVIVTSIYVYFANPNVLVKFGEGPANAAAVEAADVPAVLGE